MDKTRPIKTNIGERRKPFPEGRPGFLRVDSVHQGDLDGVKGIYHINLIDEVTQFQFVGSVERISEHYLMPVLEALITSFPFSIQAFHSDNGSEYINHRVAGLLNKLHVQEFTKSRARRTNDNALVESKNGSVVRKHLGYAHIPGRFAAQLNHFTQQTLSPYLCWSYPVLVDWSYPVLVDSLWLGIHCKSNRLLCALPPPFIFGRAQIPQRGMTALTVVERLDVFEDRRSEFQTSGPGLAVQQFGLQSREEAFGDRVIESIADSSH